MTRVTECPGCKRVIETHKIQILELGTRIEIYRCADCLGIAKDRLEWRGQ